MRQFRFENHTRSTSVVFVLGCFWLFAASDATAARPNVLLIAVDDLNDWVGPLRGHPQTSTPNFDRLARRGVTFTNAHCNVPICSPSRTSLMTGLQPFHTGVFTNGGSIFDLKGRFVTLPEHFAEAGYRTMGAGKLFHGSRGLYRQFFQAYGPDSGNQGGPFTKEELDTMKQNPTYTVDRGESNLQAVLPLNRMPDDRRTGSSRNNTFDWGPVDVSTADMPDGKVAAWAIEQLAAEYEQPFFMGVGFYRPHQPLFAPPRFFEMFPPGSVELPVTTPMDVDDLPAYAQRLARLPLTAGSHATVTNYDQWDDAVSGYLACVRFVDELLGQVLDALDRSAHADNTLIVLFSDHGYHLGEKQHWGKFTPWQESTHIPFFVVPPRNHPVADAAAGKEVSVPVSLVDLFPTVVDLCAIEQPSHPLDGQSVRALIEGAAIDADRWSERTVITTVGRGTHAIRSSRYRYVLYFDGSEELYDLQMDPHEWTNRADDPQFAAIKQKLSGALPAEEPVKQYVRYGDWKAVIFQDDQEPALLFELAAGTGSGGGIGETRSVASQHPDVMRQIRSYLAQHTGLAKRVVIPTD